MTQNNPGTAMASAVDVEVAKFREIQEQLHSMRGDYQLVLGQQTENEMVQTELALMENTSNPVVYKRVGPVLIRQDLPEAQQTVQKRLEFIGNELSGIQTKLSDKEKQMHEQTTKIQQMQSNLQRATAEAVQAIAKQHQQQNPRGTNTTG